MKIATRIVFVFALLFVANRLHAAEEQASPDVKQSSEAVNTAAPVEATPVKAAAAVEAGPVKEAAAVEAAPAKVAAAAESSGAAAKSEPAKGLVWLDGYKEAMKQGEREHKLMLIHFFRPEDQRRAEAAEAADSVANIEKNFEQDGVREKLDKFVLTKLPVNTSINVHGEEVRLLSHKAYAELRNGPGIAVIDFAHPEAEYHGYVVSVLPFTPGKYYRFRLEHLETLVKLPPGTLTQRSMILAVRIHPEQPASTQGQEDPILLSEASSQSNYQARIRLQGHHNWETRFQRIMGKLFRRGTPGAPVEVVAESWPSQDLMDSCVDCVDSWHHSEGHWNAVKAQQASYGYDIQLSDNGIWYATGIFRPKE